jgi:hypothetical protein
LRPRKRAATEQDTLNTGSVHASVFKPDAHLPKSMAGARTTASDWLPQLITRVLSLLGQLFHLGLGVAFFGLEVRPGRLIRFAKLGHTVTLLRLETLAPGLLDHLR